MCDRMKMSTIVAPLNFRGISSLILKLVILVGVIYTVVSLKERYLSSNTGDSNLVLFSGKDLETVEFPRKIWQTWHSPAVLLAAEDKERARTWQERNPRYRYELLTDRGAESFVCQYFANDTFIREIFLCLTDTILRVDSTSTIVTTYGALPIGPSCPRADILSCVLLRRQWRRIFVNLRRSKARPFRRWSYRTEK